MPTTRVIYQSEALFNTADSVDITSSTAVMTNLTGIQQFSRVQSCNYSLDISRKDVNQYGNLAAIDRVILEQPSISLDFGYLLSDFGNEKALGFVAQQTQNTLTTVTSAAATTSAMGNILTSGFVNTKNYFIRSVAQGNDANSYTVDVVGNAIGSTIAIGNGFLTNYSVNAVVGDFPKASVTCEALNIVIINGNSGTNPAVNISGNSVGGTFWLPSGLTNPNVENPSGAVFPTISALRHGDITFGLTQTAGTAYGGVAITSVASAAIQSFDIGVNLKRVNLQKLGTRYAYSKEIQFPVTLDLSIKALVLDLTTGNLIDVVNTDGTYDAVIKLAAPGTTGLEGVAYVLKRLQLDNESFSSAIGSNKEVTLKFSTQIGSSQQTDRGLFMFETLPVGI